MKNINRTWRLIISLAIPLFAGFLGSLANYNSLLSWYPSLSKPMFNPPNWIFAPVWTILFVLMGISLFIIWEQGAKKKKDKDSNYRRSAITFFGVQLVANVLWSYLFFFFQDPSLAFLEIIVLWFTIILTIFYFKGLSRLAAWLLFPYLLWVAFASVLNFVIWQLNY
ncbi:MAG: tryptophan-rich sensory protein [Candidatus Falkowbacteria bacterium]|nr:tryptophan-rich sensory protein [Candidatus Falkowbacteria bacterium]